MAPFLSRGGLGFRLKPKDLIRRLQGQGNPVCEPPPVEKAHAGARCLPQRKNGRQDSEDAITRLSGDVEELMYERDMMHVVPTCAVAGVNGTHHHEHNFAALSQDVQKHVHAILDLIKDLTGSKGDRQACQRNMPDEDVVELLERFISADLPAQLLEHLPLLEFEARKGVMNVCCALLWQGMPQRVDRQAVDYFCSHPTVFHLLADGCEQEEAALHFGVVLRSLVRHRELVEAFFRSGKALRLLSVAKHRIVAISSDAFQTLREVLMTHKEVAAPWLDANFAEFFKLVNDLLESGEYIVQRQAQKLLAELLLDRHFRRSMMAYVSSDKNLAIHMILMKDPSKAVRVEAFHLFKLFVANPQKPSRVQQILHRNKAKLLAHLELLPPLRPDDSRLGNEVRSVIERLRDLPELVSPTRAARALAGDAAADGAPQLRDGRPC